MLFDLHGKVALVTGGASGIGRAIASAFAQQHATVVILDLNEFDLQAAMADISAKKITAITRTCNVTQSAEVKKVVHEIISEFGRIDILVNSAGVAHIGNVENTAETDFDRLFQVNVKGVYNLMHHIVPHMKQKRKGVILNIASVAASVGIADRFAYSMTKGAVVAMTLSVAKDYVREGIRCNSISPGRVHTPFVDGFLKANYPGSEAEMFDKLSKTQPIGRMAQPDEIAHLALYLCSDEASFITGSDYPIDGGFIKLNT
jgi:2-keto-3-deoxy-L-fuconate dehydrogenase